MILHGIDCTNDSCARTARFAMRVPPGKEEEARRLFQMVDQLHEPLALCASCHSELTMAIGYDPMDPDAEPDDWAREASDGG